MLRLRTPMHTEQSSESWHTKLFILFLCLQWPRDTPIESWLKGGGYYCQCVTLTLENGQKIKWMLLTAV